MGTFGLSKIAFYTTCLVGVLGLAFGFGLYAGAKRTVVYDAVRHIKAEVEGSIELVTGDIWTLARLRPSHFLHPARFPGAGVTTNALPADDDSLVLLSGFFEGGNELRLIERDGTAVARWPVRFSEIFPDTSHLDEPPETDWNTDTHGALALPDGSVVFNFEYMGLVKLDRCGDVAWKIARETHHSVERAAGGGFWVPSTRRHPAGTESPFPPYRTPFQEDTIMRVSEDGQIVAEFSAPQIFYDNGLEALLTATGHSFELVADQGFLGDQGWDQEIVHLNKVAELDSSIADDFPRFEAGDLALSMREQNLVMVVDPDTRAVKWWRVGPWVRQHDPEFKPGGTIVVFNNNIYRTSFDMGAEISPLTAPRVSNIVEIDPVTDNHAVLYGDSDGQEFLTIIRGKVDPTERGGLLVTEFEGGRVFETDADGRIVWEYVNRYDEDEIAEVTEARAYPRSYFSVTDWSCGGGG